MSVRLSPPLLLSLSVGRYHSHDGAVNSVSFDDSGDAFACATDDRSIAVYSSDSGGHIKTVRVNSYGAAHIVFTHSRYDVIAASTVPTATPSIGYYSLHDNRTHRRLVGHRGAITSLCASPVDDTVLSAANDTTARIWDLRAPVCAGIIAVEAAPLSGAVPTAAFDSDGVVFAVAAAGAIELFDKRSYGAGSFTQFVLPSAAIARIAFSPDGSLIGVAGPFALTVVDAFDGAVKWSAPTPKRQEIIRFAFAPDAAVILATTDDELPNVIRAHNMTDGHVIGALPHPTPPPQHNDDAAMIRALAVAPNRALLLTAETRGIAMRIPQRNE